MLNSEELIGLLPELEWIDCKSLKLKVIETWIEAAKAGQWSYESLKKLPFVLVELENCPVSLIGHVRNVTQLAAEIGAKLSAFYSEYLKIDRDFVLAGALLHDVGKLLEYSNLEGKLVPSQFGKLLRHPTSGALLAFKCGVPAEVCHIISVHSFEGTKSYISPEAFIVKNADWLNFDFLGYCFPCSLKH